MLSGRHLVLALALTVIAVPAHAATIQIVMQDLVFAPAEVTANVGDTQAPTGALYHPGGLDRVRRHHRWATKERRGGLSFRLALCRAAYSIRAIERA